MPRLISALPTKAVAVDKDDDASRGRSWAAIHRLKNLFDSGTSVAVAFKQKHVKENRRRKETITSLSSGIKLPHGHCLALEAIG